MGEIILKADVEKVVCSSVNEVKGRRKAGRCGMGKNGVGGAEV